jgi:hypothetical protein
MPLYAASRGSVEQNSTSLRVAGLALGASLTVVKGAKVCFHPLR